MNEFLYIVAEVTFSFLMWPKFAVRTSSLCHFSCPGLYLSSKLLCSFSDESLLFGSFSTPSYQISSPPSSQLCSCVPFQLSSSLSHPNSIISCTVPTVMFLVSSQLVSFQAAFYSSSFSCSSRLVPFLVPAVVSLLHSSFLSKEAASAKRRQVNRRKRNLHAFDCMWVKGGCSRPPLPPPHKR